MQEQIEYKLDQIRVTSIDANSHPKSKAKINTI